MYMIVDRNDFYELYENSWSGARNTLDCIREADKEVAFMGYLEEVFSWRNTPTETEVNDFIWFESDTIYKDLGLDENGEKFVGENGEKFVGEDDDEDYQNFCSENTCETCKYEHCATTYDCWLEFNRDKEE